MTEDQHFRDMEKYSLKARKDWHPNQRGEWRDLQG